MADEERAKAEKLAAAKKRFEQLKKEQQKKGKKAGGTKKKDEEAVESKVDEAVPAQDLGEIAATDGKQKTVDEPTKPAADDVATDETTRPGPTRKTSVSVQSKQRSESFRQGSTPLSTSGEVQDVYHKQAARIEELERENAAFQEQQEASASQLTKAEEQLETWREHGIETSTTTLEAKAKEVEMLQSELSSTQMQLAQLQQAAKGTNRRMSAVSPGITEQLASKTSVIESLKLEVSNLRNQVNQLENTVSERQAAARDLNDRAQAAETATTSVQQELDTLKVSIAIPSDETQAANEDPEALTKRITVLESDLRTAHTNLEVAANRASSLEQKIQALTKLHRDATNMSQSKDRDISDLRNQLRRRDRGSHVRDASEFELGEEETESGTLQARIRALEADNFDLRRGVWRDKRAEMQPGMQEDGGGPSPEYEDVDLNGPYTPQGRGRLGSEAKHSTFQDVLTSGINAFTGWPREVSKTHGANSHPRKQSLGLLSEDDDEDFDPEAFRLAQEEDAKRRIERVREVKRGLDDWRGWRIDLMEMRQASIGGRECGPVFEV